MESVGWLRHGGLAGVLWLGVASAALGQKWASDMFDHTSHDFGTVARGAKVEHRFKIENIYVEDAHIKSVQSSCGCAAAEATKTLLKTWDTAEIVAKIDTRGYLGRKDATIKVKFDRPFEGEVQLQIHCNIRGDVVVQPGVVQFGPVAQGASSQQHTAISYAGRGDWRIVRVESPNANLAAAAVESSRVGGRVDYDLAVTLQGSAPPGYLRDELVLVTNDANPQAARVPVPVEALIQPSITVRPSPLLMGSVGPGETVTRQLVVHGNPSFHVLRVESTDKRFHCGPPTGAGNLYRVPVSFTAAAGEAVGRADAKIRIETDAPAGRSMEVGVSVEVVGEPAATPPGANPPPVSPPSEPRLIPVPQ
jgi:hypothetical protein